jgi:two-component system chemotaxis sensor kinase CheA
VDYDATGKGEPFKETEVSRKRVADLIVRIIASPTLHSNGNIRIDKPNTNGDKPAFYYAVQTRRFVPLHPTFLHDVPAARGVCYTLFSMTVPQYDSSILARATEILGQIGEELAFVEADRDAGLLPINSLLMDFEELSGEGSPEALAIGLAAIRALLDQILDASGNFSDDSIRFLNDWHAWMTSVLTAWERGSRMPPAPASWNRSRGAVAMASVAASGTIPPPAANAQPVAADPAIRLNLADDSELLHEFHSESLELLQTIEQGVLLLEDNPTDTGTINAIFRAFHTFKGSAGLLHLDALRDLAHDLESLLDGVRRSECRISTEVIELILAGADALKAFTSRIGAQLQGMNSGDPIGVPTRQLRQRVRATLSAGPSPSTRPLPASATAFPMAEGPESAGSEPAEQLAVPPESQSVSPPAESADSGKIDRESSVKADSATGFVKIDTRKLDSLVELVGELVIAQSMVFQDPDVQRLPSRHLARCLRQLGRITTDLQRTAMSLRMVPIGRTFRKMTRLVRDLAAQQQKQVQLVVEGEETELDRNIVEELSDPLVHMIRNAVDHGLELPAQRITKAKQALGTIRLSASHQRGGIVIAVQDDGRGLDRDRILAKARERGVVKANSTLTDAEIFALIFAPGFSTAEVVTDLSGRGVGMDVVRRNIEKLRGKVEIQSVAGHGTTFTIVLPLTLAIIDGMLVGVGDDRYIIPTLSVRESFRPRPGMVTTVHERREVVSVRGRLTPLLRLGQHLGTRYRAVDPTDGIIVVVESGDATRGLLVDELHGKQEVVIKSLGETFRRQDLLAGAAILGDGRVGLILDVDTLVRCRESYN